MCETVKELIKSIQNKTNTHTQKKPSRVSLLGSLLLGHVNELSELAFAAFTEPFLMF